jgi:cytochrome c oxidase accessory protein FixG
MQPSDESFRDRIATVDAEGKRKWIFAQKPKGRFYAARTWASRAFFLLFLTLPFIKVNDRPLFLFNIPEAKFIIFGKIFWPQDFFIFGLAMVTFIIIIVLFTAAFGRLFCGWVCPQTIFMEMVFRKIEYLIEGDAAQQKVLAKMPWNSEKIRKKAGKHAIFFGVAFIIANYFLAYIIGVDQLWKIITEPVSEHWVGLLSLIVFSSVFYSVYAFFREQACTVVCPYGRLQSVLLDRNSMIVAYDHQRGEPRGKFKKGEENSGLGDCIDCFNCVRVCPTGIDIRNGTQMECVGCTACIDACDHIMDSIGKPRGLVRYASENGISLQQPLRYTGRMKFYTLVLIILTGLLSLLLITRKDIDGTIVRTRGQLYQEVGTDSLSNLFDIKIINKTMKDKEVTLRLEGEYEQSGKVSMIGNSKVHLNREDQAAGSFFITLPKKALKQRTVKLQVGLYEGENRITTIKTNFTGPFTRGG